MIATSKDGNVFNLTEHHPAARLYDFDIDGIKLKYKHIDWLDKNIILRIKGSSDTWRISLSGSTDRLGAADYNLKLSERRVKEVEKYIRAHPALGGVHIIFDTSWEGELPASLTDKDETRDDWERAVLVTMNLLTEPPPRPIPPIIQRPKKPNVFPRVISPCETKATCPKSKSFSIRIITGIELSLPRTPITGARFTFLLRDTVNKLEAVYEFSGKGISVSPIPFSLTGMVTKFTDFETEYETRVVDFGRMAEFKILSIPSKPPPAPLPPMPSLNKLTIGCDKGTFFRSHQDITNLDTGAIPSLPGGAIYSGPFILVSKCRGGEGAVRY